MDTVRHEVVDGVGRLVLDRPAALNALDLDMIREMTRVLDGWRDDPEVRTVLVAGGSPRAFCAGGDIRAARAASLAGDEENVAEFFRAEYALNGLIAEYPKPYVALLDGIAMGGGLGISAHGSIRVVTERSRLAMPETGIGFFPDVGSTYFLPRLRGASGRHLGLTGVHIGAGAAVDTGLATHHVPAERLPDLVAALGTGTAAEVVAGFATPPPVSELAPVAEAVDRCFAADSVEEVVARLEAETGPHQEWARATLATLAAMSPTSLHLAAGLFRRGAASSLRECLARELRVAAWAAHSHDFHEGVRAQLVDKDRRPRWSPATLAEVDTALVTRVLDG
ncbi:enoyl-CoA hydratase [Actinoalloteichus sp. AHMU CJ021]|uniref:enoyl-CoA hydratase/isomerase family protein n=1 Tax=Actinoalloteichus sp. AHMU CJ021 TaxID=2072503 RepID=UPI000CA02B39|nr:enoyl-CoA hydratase [Actinoalloteichus sp. AHMU CJ021]